MKRILTLIVTLVCVLAAYSQNTVYIWKGNTLSVQAADSLTIDRSTDDLVDMGLSVMWARSEASSGCAYSYAKTAVKNQSSWYRLPTKEDAKELVSQCKIVIQPNRYVKFIATNGNSISLRYNRLYSEGNMNGGWHYLWLEESLLSVGSIYYDDPYNYAEIRPSCIGFVPTNKQKAPVRAVCSY